MWETLWVSCESDEKGLKMTRVNFLRNDELHSGQNSTFVWLEGEESDSIDSNDSIVVPLGDDEEFCSGGEEIIVESNIEEDVFHLDLKDEETIPWETNLEDEDNGKILPLFISHILCCEQYQKCFKLGSLVFKTVEIFGTIVATQITNRKNTLLVDDGTSQIMCYMEDSVNDDNEYDDSSDDENHSVDSLFDQFSQFYKKKIKEYEYTQPTYDEINVGDRVHIEGNVSLYKGKFYLFVKFLNRPEGNSGYIDFVENIFRMYDISYYDFGIINPLRSHVN